MNLWRSGPIQLRIFRLAIPRRRGGIGWRGCRVNRRRWSHGRRSLRFGHRSARRRAWLLGCRLGLRRCWVRIARWSRRCAAAFIWRRRRRHLRIRRRLRKRVAALQRFLVRSGCRRGRLRRGLLGNRRRSAMPHPVSQPEAQPAQEQKGKNNPYLRTGAECHLGVVPRVV